MVNYSTPESFGRLADQIVTIEARVSAMRQDVMQPLLTAASLLRQKLTDVDMSMTH